MKRIMKPEIRTLLPVKLIGQRLTMSFAENKTFELWNTFIACKSEISNVINADMYNIQFYPENFFMPFNPVAMFDKCAAVAVSNQEDIPEGMEAIDLSGGLYAVFNYKGDGKDAPEVFQYIMGEWLPKSGYRLDNRPHFEILGEKYKQGYPDSEEEIWIPIK